MRPRELPTNARSSDRDIWLDDLDLGDALIGNGVVLIAGDELTLYAVTGGRARFMGTFDDAGAAWATLDALDVRRTPGLLDSC